MQNIAVGITEMSGSTAAAVIFYTVMTVSAVIMLVHYLRSEKPFKTALKGMASGGAGLVALHFFGGSFGLALPLNLFTAFISLTLGLPGAAAMAVVRLLFSV